ncbi:focadhesin-like [Saccostrea echinata]|uniref:focadhesin-like n=1 Tax=Saccostrea echinata TaxID=191078 RepID=UPI002A8269B7|nr:focadhesin-like [Saccostrea echinata]
MMEDLKRRLEFDNMVIQRQALNKLCEEVKKNLSRENRLTNSSVKNAEYRLLEEKCGAMETVVAKAISTAMVELVSDGLADFSTVLESFLNQVPNAKNLCGIVQGVSDLLVWQASILASTKEGYTNPYTLRSPPHPFITILTNRPDSWPLLGNQVNFISSVKEKRIQSLAVEILEPFMKFVFAEPLDSPQYQPMKICLQRELLTIVSQSDDSRTVEKFLGCIANILPCLQVKDKNSLGSTAQFVMGFVDVCRAKISGKEATFQKFLTYLVDLCLEFHSHSLDVSNIMCSLVRVAESAPSALSSDNNMISMGSLLLKTDIKEAVVLLTAVRRILENESGDLSLVAIASLILPLLQILSMSSSGSRTHDLKSTTSVSGEVLKIIEEKLVKTQHSREKQKTSQFNPHLTSLTFLNNNFSLLARALEEDEELPRLWLQNLVNSVSSLKFVPIQLTVIVSALFVLSPGKPWADQSLKALQAISKTDHKQACFFLPLYIYQLNKCIQPEYKLSIMKSVPSVAQHKFCIPLVLRTIQTFGSTPRLKALSIQLLADLWKLQDRCFPYLLKAISEPAEAILTKEGVDEVKLAKAKAIHDVCLLRGEQHGSDMLSPLSELLENSIQEVDSPVASLALEGLYYLCKDEVIDILSAWSVLGEKLTHDPRSIVQERICKLFSLLPELEVKTEEFERFHQYAVSALWLFVHGSDPDVSRSALKALSQFDIRCFSLAHIPDKVKEDIVKQAQAIIDRGDNPDLTVEDVVKEVPGICYTRMLAIISPEVYEGYREFLCEHVGSEVKNLGRGVYHGSARRLGMTSTRSKMMDSIPAFLQQQYDTCKQPGLRPGLAAGVLFSYDPPIEVARDGRPRKHYTITHSKNFQHMFTTLLHEVTIQPSNWQQMMQLPQAWVAFIDRLFTSAVEGRKAEIDLQLKKEHIGEEEAREKQKVAWLWVRDKLTDLIKSASRESPSVQGNAVLSLGGLVLATQKHWVDLDKETQGQLDQVKEFQTQSHWVTIVMDTLMSLMDVTYQPKGSILGICQQRSVSDRMTCSFLTQASSVLALCQLTPVMINIDVNRIFVISETLTKWLPGQPEAPEALVLQLAYGLGLGCMLGKLLEEHFMDTCGSKEIVQMWNTFDKLEDACFTGRDDSCGCLLGLGLSVSALCNDSKTEARAHVLTVLDKLQVLHQQSTSPGDIAHQVLSVGMALIHSAAFNANIVSSDKVLSTVDKIIRDLGEAPQSAGIAMAAGILLYNLTRAGITGITDCQVQLHQTWTKNLTSSESSPLLKVAAMTGLMALIGSQKALTSSRETLSMALGDVNVDEVVRVMTRVVSMGDDIGIQNTAAWMLGNHYLSVSPVSETRTSVPTSLGYLPETSLLRAVVDFLIDAGKRGPEAVPDSQVECCLRSLLDRVRQNLPPVNWAWILTPLMRLNFNDEVRRLCLHVAITQSSSSTTAAMLVSSWMTQPLIHSLSVTSRCLLYDELPVLVTSVSPVTLTSLLDLMQKEIGDPYLHGLFGLHRALKVHNLPKAASDILLQCLESVYKKTKTQQNEPYLLHLIGECLGSVPDEVFDELTESDFSEEDNHFLSCFVRCYLVAQGRQPLALLNRCVDASLNNADSDTEDLHALFYHTFWHISQSKAESNGVQHQLQWLLELLGHTRNVSTGAITLSDKVNIDKVVEFGVRLVAAAISIWTSSSIAFVYNINPQFLMERYPSSPLQEGHDLSLSKCPQSPVHLLPSYITGLGQEPWSQISLKVLDWLALMQRRQTSSSHSLSAAEIGLKHSADFRRTQTWTDILQRYPAVSV